MDHVTTFLSVIDTQDELFASLHTRYVALAEERKREKVPVVATSVSPAPLSLQALLQTQNESATAVKRECLEDRPDPVRDLLGHENVPVDKSCPFVVQRMFRIPLIPTPAVPGWEGIKGQAHASRLPDASLDPRTGNNCLILRYDLHTKPLECVASSQRIAEPNLSISLDTHPGGTRPLTLLMQVTLLRRCATRVSAWTPRLAAGEAPNASTFRCAFDGALEHPYPHGSTVPPHTNTPQGYKLGSWATKTWRLSGGPEDPFPRSEGAAFWWRVLLMPPPPRGPGGFAAFVDGRLVGWSAGPRGWEAAALGRLQISLPASGEAGERLTLKVSQLWWGACELDAATAAEVSALVGATAAPAPAAGPGGGALASRNLWVTGIPDAATLPELLRAFEPYGAVDVNRAAGRPGAAIVDFADVAAAAEGLRKISSSGGVRLHGAALAVALGVAGIK